MTPVPFAYASDVEARWRPLSDSEKKTADVLAADASDMIRSRWSDVDSRLESGALTHTSVIRVVAGMVRRAMMNSFAEGVTQQSQAAGPFNIAQTFSNPNGNLYLSASDIATLDGAGRRKRAFAVDMTPTHLPSY